MQSLVKAMKALSDDTRLRIINVLLEDERCVCEVMQALEISQTRASRNLNMLYDAGFLKLRKDGLWSFYSLDKEGMPEYLLRLIEAVKLSLANNAFAEADRERLRNTARSGVSCAYPQK